MNSLVADNISVGKVFGNDTAAGLLLLGDIIAVTLGLVLVMVTIILIVARGAGDLDLGGTELGIVEEQGSLGSGLLLEGYGGLLGRVGLGDIEAGDLSTVKN